MTEIEKLKKLTGSTDDDLMELLLDSAEEEVLAYTNRTHIPGFLKKTVRDIAIIMFNRLGTEGETSRSEAGEKYNFTNGLPDNIVTVLNGYRLASVGGAVYENEGI